MTCYLFKQFLSFFIRLVLGSLFQHNRHLLILNGHGSHVILKAIEQTYEIGLNMITFPSHPPTLYILWMSTALGHSNLFLKRKEMKTCLGTTIKSQTR
jgi:hypothetical protein